MWNNGLKKIKDSTLLSEYQLVKYMSLNSICVCVYIPMGNATNKSLKLKKLKYSFRIFSLQWVSQICSDLQSYFMIYGTYMSCKCSYIYCGEISKVIGFPTYD